MPAVAIIGSVLSHGGAVIAGSTTTNANGIPIARVTDAATCTTHGATTILTGSSTRSDLDGKFIATIGSITACGATITTGDPTVLITL